MEWSQPRRRLRTTLRPRWLQIGPLLGVQIRPAMETVLWSLRIRRLRAAPHNLPAPPSVSLPRREIRPHGRRPKLPNRRVLQRRSGVPAERSIGVRRRRRARVRRAQGVRQWCSTRTRLPRRARCIHPAKSRKKSITRPANRVWVSYRVKRAGYYLRGALPAQSALCST